MQTADTTGAAMSSASESRPGSARAPFICVPLYIYPAPGAWGPLVRAARERPGARFQVIVNPGNGPGDAPLPDANYVAAVRELAALPNVKVLGYVHVTYGKRDAADVRADIEKYAAWERLDGGGGMRVDGIFFDEAPAEFAMLGYISNLSRFARKTLREANGKRGSVMLNPGVVVPRAFYDVADYVVAFEQAHSHWRRTRDEFVDAVGLGIAAKTVVMVHSCHVGNRGVESLACEVRDAGVAGQFVTEQMDGGYSKWSSWWDHYVGFVCPDGAEGH